MRKIVFPRYDEKPEDGVSLRRMLGTALIMFGFCGGSYITPVPLLAERERLGGGLETPPGMLWLALGLGIASLATLLVGALLVRKEEMSR